MSKYFLVTEPVKEPTPYIVNGQPVTRAEFMKGAKGISFGEAPDCQITEGWPIHSTAAKVHPKQIPEAIAAAKRRGVRIEFDKKGRPIFESARHQTEYLKVRGLFNMDGGYAETQPGNLYQWQG